jgi:hypothetical protein
MAKERDKDQSKKGKSAETRNKPWGFWRKAAVVLVVLLVFAGIGRAMLPGFVRDHVNKTLDRNLLYTGKVGEVRMHLWRGAYSIADVQVSKAVGNVPVPLFAAERVDFSIQWNALWHGKIVGRMHMEAPELNFVDSSEHNEDQTGAGGPWLEIISDLFPFRINQATVRDGSVHFRAFESASPVNVYLSDLNGVLDNLTNIRDETAPLVSTVRATALMMDQAKFEFNMTLDPFSYRPTFELALRMLGLDVTTLNNLARAYGKFDFEHGWFDLVIEAQAREGQIEGYVKPLFRNLQVFSLDDLTDQNPLQIFWQALVGAVTTILANPARDQFGTLIPFTGDLSESTNADILATLGNVFRNAFVRAFLPRLEGAQETGFLSFAPPDLTDPISVGEW